MWCHWSEDSTDPHCLMSPFCSSSDRLPILLRPLPAGFLEPVLLLLSSWSPPLLTGILLRPACDSLAAAQTPWMTLPLKMLEICSLWLLNPSSFIKWSKMIAKFLTFRKGAIRLSVPESSRTGAPLPGLPAPPLFSDTAPRDPGPGRWLWEHFLPCPPLFTTTPLTDLGVPQKYQACLPAFTRVGSLPGMCAPPCVVSFPVCVTSSETTLLLIDA